MARFDKAGNPVICAYRDKDDKGLDITLTCVEQWVSHIKGLPRLNLFKVHYSASKASQILANVSENSGPELYRIQTDESTPKLLAVMWQRVKSDLIKGPITNSVSVYLYDLETGSTLDTILTVRADEIERQWLLEQINRHLHNHAAYQRPDTHNDLKLFV